MSDLAIRIEGVGKQYRIGRRQSYKTLRDTLADAFASPFRRVGAWLRSQPDGPGVEQTIWALRDASFEIRAGEVVGLIGRNGAGKSTLLKILSRITEPTSGHGEIYGRVGSLLEVGTGFHPELTGRENIFLSGAILGMRKTEIERKFDEIVAFSEIETYIDTAVKHYSSGMYVRLAFAVAAHLETEILLVDEVLAVGDVQFQKKCLEKMEDFRRAGRTSIFVSHNMSVVQNLCPRVIVLREGRVSLDGPGDEAIRDYLSSLAAGAERAFEDNPERRGSGAVRLTAASVLDLDERPSQHLVAGSPAAFQFTYENRIGAGQARLALTIYNQMGVAVTSLDTRLTGFHVNLAERGRLVCRIPVLPLPLGQYRIATSVILDGKSVDWVPNALVFDVVSSTFFQSSLSPPAQTSACLVQHQWTQES
jgi:lipopolysaccharide transport system ATP-binding protein